MTDTETPIRFALDDRPQAIANVEVAVFDGEAVLFDEAAQMVHRLNAVAAATWISCDGETTIAEMITELAEVFDASATVVSEQIQQALHLFVGEGLLLGHIPPMRMHLRESNDIASDGSEIITAPGDP